MATRPPSSRQGRTPQDPISPTDDKENKATNGQIKAGLRSRGAGKSPKTYCLCHGPDDGSPMIHCSECKDWYHFNCVKLDERAAEDIESYVCPTCTEKTGLRTIMEWEGPDAFEDHPQSKQRVIAKQPQRRKKPTVDRILEEDELSLSPSEGSEDEYVAETGRTAAGKRRARRVSSPPDSDAEPGPSVQKASKKARIVVDTVKKSSTSPSPGPISATKRKQSFSAHPEPKRKKSDSSANSKVQAARQYCLTKFEELFCRIFLQYPFVGDGVAQSSSSDSFPHPEKRGEDLTDEEKEKLRESAKHFSADLEACLFRLYLDSDKASIGEYKNHFIMITFNLGHADRVMLHTRIAASQITPEQLSTMSSNDLADEQMKLSIKQREQEALEHSILQKQALPRAKITHKGIENIEDANGTEREVQRRREEEEQDRIERERLARIRVQAPRAVSGSIPPESPITPQTPQWGAPPPVPQSSDHHGRPQLNPLFVPSASDVGPPVENELNLADLINIDDETPTPSTAVEPAPAPFGESASPNAQEVKSSGLPTASPSQTTGISPFAAQFASRDAHSRPSFDLNALWTPKAPAEHERGASAELAYGESTEHAMDVDTGEEADDQDFDMFLGKDEETTSPGPSSAGAIPATVPVAFGDAPPVWSGSLSMPLDSTMAQEVPVDARQSGGRTLDDPLLWQTLFPSRELRIDGRVPVEKSAEYLTQMRLNPTKELIAVAFVPTPGLDDSGFTKLTDHLIGKGRHGLVFPWGQRPKEHAPGRELYIIPLLSTDTLPDFMELLDDLKLPKPRSVNYLIGIWILNKGKLTPAPAPTPVPQAAPPPQPAVDLAMIQHTLATAAAGGFPLPVLPLGTADTTLPSSAPTTAAPSASSLAAEVASLTPEQLSAVLRNLSYLQPQTVSTVSAITPSTQPVAPVIPLQPFMNPAPPMPAYTPPNVPYGAPPPPSPSQPYPDNSYNRYDGYGPDQYDYDYGYHGEPHPSSGRGGYRGRGGSRGRGRGNDRYRDGGYHKSRGRGRAGYAPSSPPRDRRGAWGDGARW